MDSNIINMLTNYNDIYEMYISTNVSIYMDIYGEIVPPTKRVSPR